MRPIIGVTGSSGMIGTRLCEKLLENGFEIVGLDIEPNSWNKSVAQKTILIDLRDPAQFSKIPLKIDFFIHLAANARVYDLVVRPDLAFDNQVMAYNCLEFCRRNGIKKFIFASSREVYGNQGKTVYSENEARIEYTESPYASSKISSESLIRSYQKCYGIDFGIVRFSNVYGMYDHSNRLIPTTFQLIRQNKPVTVFGKDKALDFTYIDDSVKGLMLLIQKFESAKNESYNIAFGKEISIETVVRSLRDQLNAKNEIIVTSSRPGEVQRFCADISKARKKLGFSPDVPFEEGLKKTVEWYQKNP